MTFALQEMDIDNRMALYQHVILSGGSTLFPGLPTRLERDIRALYLTKVLQVLLHPLRLVAHQPLDKHFPMSCASAHHSSHDVGRGTISDHVDRSMSGQRRRTEQQCHGMVSTCAWQGNKEGLRRLKLKVEVPPRRKHAVFSGGSVLADIMRASDDFWISREEWQADPDSALAKCVRL